MLASRRYSTVFLLGAIVGSLTLPVMTAQVRSKKRSQVVDAERPRRLVRRQRSDRRFDAARPGTQREALSQWPLVHVDLGRLKGSDQRGSTATDYSRRGDSLRGPDDGERD